MRELIVSVAFCALGIASLRTGGLLAAFVTFAGIVLVMAFAIIAFVGNAQPKAFAIGFLLPLFVYAVTVFAAGGNELDPYAGRLPTTRFLRYAHQALVKTTYIDFATGKVVPNYDPSKDPNKGRKGFGGPSLQMSEHPDRETFMLLAHQIFAIVLGWIGAKFAVYVHQTQSPHPGRGETREEPRSR